MSNTSLQCLPPERFEFISEFDNFLDLFPHRGSFLWAPHPAAGERPSWNTETRHLLTDRLIRQGSYLYGVRFGATTHYLMIDLDRKSPYHPYRDPFAVVRILAALEPLGLVRYVASSSSYSGGIHLYFPFVQGQSSWAIARAATILLENAGFKPHRGQLELFPNNRLSFGADYNGHRLPLQTGSYLLDSDWNPIHTTHTDFVQRWHLAQNANPVHPETLEHIIKSHGRRTYRRIRGNAQKFLNDLNAEINPGWTGFGQTNHLLGKIAIREYVFHHAIHGGTPLTGDRLAAEIFAVAESLPGYDHWCQHKHDLASLCLYWARCVELSNYYPYQGKKPVDSTPLAPTWNEQQANDARERIRIGVAQLIERGEMPQGIRARHLAIKKLCKVGSDALYKNKDLWHGEIDLKPAPHLPILPDQAKQDDPRSLEPAPNGVIRAPGTNKLIPSSVPAPQGQERRRAITPDQGEREGEIHPTESEPKLEGVALLRSILTGIEKRNRQQRAHRVIAAPETPPDEIWFQPLLAGLNSE